MRQLLIVIAPAPLASKSGQNRRVSRQKGAEIDAQAKSDAGWITVAALGRRTKPRWAGVTAAITWHTKTSAKPGREPGPDRLNYGSILKAHFDGIFAVLGLDDRIVHTVRFGTPRVDRHRPRVEILLEGASSTRRTASRSGAEDYGRLGFS